MKKWKIQEWIIGSGLNQDDRDYFRVVPENCPEGDERTGDSGLYRAGRESWRFTGWADRPDEGLFDTPKAAEKAIYAKYPEEDAWWMVSVQIVKDCTK